MNVQDLRDLGDNLAAIQDSNRAQNIPVPAELEAEGPRAVDLWRKMIINGASVEDANRVTNDPDFIANVELLDGIDSAIGVYGKQGLPKELRYLLAQGLAVVMDKATGKIKSLPAKCDTFGRCMDLVDGFLAELDKRGKSFAELTRGLTAEIVADWKKYTENENHLGLASMFDRMVQICQDDPEA